MFPQGEDDSALDLPTSSLYFFRLCNRELFIDAWRLSVVSASQVTSDDQTTLFTSQIYDQRYHHFGALAARYDLNYLQKINVIWIPIFLFMIGQLVLLWSVCLVRAL